MNAAEILTLLKRRALEPFAIHVSDGTRHEVRHPDMVIVTPRAVYLGIAENGEHAVAQRVAICDLRHVTQLAPLRKPKSKPRTARR